MPLTETTTDLLAVLKRHWGYDSFRPLQEEAVRQVLDGGDCLIVLPTGGGKSLCYQLPAAASPGLALVVSPLIALMDDQVAAARENGLRAAALHSNLDASAKTHTRQALNGGELDLLYVSPERLSMGDLLPQLRPQLRLAAIDEAHCISHWGHDFRPEYRMLAQILDQVPEVPRLALTATATPQVQADICQMLRLRQPRELVGHIDRANLRYRCWPRKNAVQQIQSLIDEHPKEGGIVYALTRRETERIAGKLQQLGINAAFYHAGMAPAQRAAVQREFLAEHIDVVCATVAFGMGIDRSNVRFVVHAGLPRSIEHYQQESGRAGRDGLPADCVLLASAGDLTRHRQLAHKDGGLTEERSRALEAQLRDIGRFAHSPVCRHQLLCQHFGQDYQPPSAAGCGACDVCLGETGVLPDAEALLIAQKILSAVWRLRNRYGILHVVKVLRGLTDDKIRRGAHDTLSVYGILREHDDNTVKTWIDQLIVQNLCCIDESSGYPLLCLTDSGVALCKGTGTVRLGQAQRSPAKAARDGSSRSDGSAPEWTGVDRPCYDRLRALRRLIAEEIGKPPYIVFSDTTLRELARIKPANDEELLDIKGIGETKRARFGPAFLTAIQGADADVALLDFDQDIA